MLVAKNKYRRLQECESRADILDEDSNSLFHYILLDIDEWLHDEEGKHLLALFNRQLLSSTINHRNRNNESPLFIAVSTLHALEDQGKSESVASDSRTSVMSLEKDTAASETLIIRAADVWCADEQP